MDINTVIVAGYITNCVTKLLPKNLGVNPQTLYVWITPKGTVELSFKSNWPQNDGIPLIGANVFSVELGLDMNSEAVKNAYVDQDHDLILQLFKKQTLEKVYQKALVRLNRILPPEPLIKAAMSAETSDIEMKEQLKSLGPTHAIH